MSSSLLPLITAAAGLLQATGQTGQSRRMQLLDLPEAWVLVLVILPMLLLITWLGYGRENISSFWRALLSGLRIGAMALLLLVLARPVLVERREEVHPAEVLILVDDSASMQRVDAYTGDAASRRAVEKLGGTPGLQPRHELVRSLLEQTLLPAIANKEYEARLFRFAETATPLTELEGLTGRGQVTHLGDALTQALAANRGRNVSDVVVLSDGRSNGGLPVLDAARAASAAGIPVHTLVVGDTRPERNAIVELVEAPSNALEGDELVVSVRVTGRGTQEVDRTQVVLEELGGGRGSATGGNRSSTFDDRVVAEETIPLGPQGERVVLVAPPESMLGGELERRFRVSVSPLAGETLLDDNQIEFTVRISPEKIRVLYVDGYPRWEYRYLKNLLLRADENLEVRCFLLSATPDFIQESSKGLEPLAEVPTSRKELLDGYDVVILGDVNPHAVSPDPARGDEFVNSLREFVESGGGLLFQAGEFDNPRSFIDPTLLDLLPVLLDSTGALQFEGDTRSEFRPTLEDPTQPHEIARLHPDAELNRRLWEEEGGLRGFYWYFPVNRAKPASQVLLRHPNDQNQYGRLPLLVAGYYPAGRTLFLGLDSTWMWRFRYGDRYHERFWRNAIRWLALGRLKSGDRRYQLEATRTSYNLDERAVLEARVLDEDYQPSEQATVEARWSGPDGRTEDLTMPAVPERAGLYRSTLQLERPGLYRAWIDVDGVRVSATEFDVLLPSRENQDPSPDPEILSALSAMTGGTATNLAGHAELLRPFPGGEERREPISSRLEDAWDHWGTLLLALVLLSAEWILRKRLELV